MDSQETTKGNNPNTNNADQNAAVNMIRGKLDALYAEEPDAKLEAEKAEQTTHRSKHQQFMHNLSNSGRSLADIQTAWHEYYQSLPDVEKHEVWTEFYQQHNRATTAQTKPAHTHTLTKSSRQHQTMAQPVSDPRSVADIKQQLTKRVSAQSRRKRGGHLKSLMFGLSSGFVVVIILLFGFFNERFIAPFISPSKSISDTSIIIDPTSTAVGPEPKLIIPKINVEIPVIYDEPSIAEDAMQAALERGVVHYATTSNPGELGNGAIFGHSSNNILNKGKYKFAFVLLNRLEAGDTFIIQKDSKRYVYKVFEKKVVKPQDLSVLTYTGGKPATFSLITCDPPGTTLNRLVVTAEQITPDPGANVASTAPTATQQPAILPGNADSLWSRLTKWLRS